MDLLKSKITLKFNDMSQTTSQKIVLTLDQQKNLLDAAINAKNKAYCPYSKFQVGCSLLSVTDQIYSGCNLETSNYHGACAEKSAAANMLLNGETKAKAAVVVTNEMNSTSFPCGACRQTLREFCHDVENFAVYSFSGDGKNYSVMYLGELLPCSFGPENLLDSDGKSMW